MNLAGALSAREIEVLHRLSEGLSNKQMARQLSITEGTTKAHLRQIFRKLDVPNRTAAAVKARDLGL